MKKPPIYNPYPPVRKTQATPLATPVDAVIGAVIGLGIYVLAALVFVVMR